MDKTFTREFPHRTCHEGTMLGNGWLGLYLWGEGRTLRVTVGCATLWDHRGGLEWSERQNYADIRQALEAQDAARLQAIFTSSSPQQPDLPERPTLIPAGRIELTLRDGAELLTSTADYSTGLVTATYRLGNGEFHAELQLDMTDKGRFALRCDDLDSLKVLSGYTLADPALAKRGLIAPIPIDFEAATGFMQLMPADDPFALCACRQSPLVACRLHRDASTSTLRDFMKEHTRDFDWEAVATANAAWWANVWERIPAIELSNRDLQAIYAEGMAKFAMMTAPDGYPAGLQGAWIEDNALPPWSGDYHFNINVQMCYWPAYRGNLTDNLLPLFRLLADWRPIMRRTAKLYIGIDDGYMLPHAVDDRCVCMGNFWTGAIDLACGAWMAQMMFDYADYTGDETFLRDLALDFMGGVFNTMYAMLEWRDGHLVLPVSVSPEYRGAAMNAWGPNASFQLAALLRLARDLQLATQWLRLEPDPRWQEVRDFLPEAALIPTPHGGTELALWEGQPLEESHRHHSHLGAICPFDTIDPDDPRWRDTAHLSYQRWIRLGMGLWSGWCMPWAAMLHTRFNNGPMTELTLDIWRRVFVNPGGGTLHDPAFDGFSALCFGGHRDIMQMDATMGAVTAIQDLLLHARQDTIHLFAGASPNWDNASFTRMPAPGGLLISASRQRHGNLKAMVTATRHTSLRLVIHDHRTLRGHLDGHEILPDALGRFTCDLQPGHTLAISSIPTP